MYGMDNLKKGTQCPGESWELQSICLCLRVNWGCSLPSSDKTFIGVHVSLKNYQPFVCVCVEGLKQFINIFSQDIQSSAEYQLKLLR
jgi:hypothetical protein